MKESFRRPGRQDVAPVGIPGLPGSSPRGGRVSLRLLTIIAVVTLAAGAVVLAYGRRGSAIRYQSQASQRIVASSAEESEERSLRRPAPDSDDPDAGVAEAARAFAIELVTPNLAYPESADFPAEAVHVGSALPMNIYSEGRMPHWLVDGAVDSLTDRGARVRSSWRLVLERSDGEFLPVLASLEGREIFYLRGHREMLLEARMAALEERKLEKARKKREELAREQSIRRSIEASKPVETKAQAALKLAVDLLTAGRTEAARRRLQEVIERFPDTSAAAQAEELLQK